MPLPSILNCVGKNGASAERFSSHPINVDLFFYYFSFTERTFSANRIGASRSIFSANFNRIFQFFTRTKTIFLVTFRLCIFPPSSDIGPGWRFNFQFFILPPIKSCAIFYYISTGSLTFDGFFCETQWQKAKRDSIAHATFHSILRFNFFSPLRLTFRSRRRERDLHAKSHKI